MEGAYLLAVADVDGDGTLDLAASSLTGAISLLRGDPAESGNFGAPVPLVSGAPATALATAGPELAWAARDDTLGVCGLEP